MMKGRQPLEVGGEPVYEFIKGNIARVSTDSIVIENNGIGYIVFCPNPYQFTVEQDSIVYTHLYVREDAMNLYGFKLREERQLFVQLLGVSGIGPKGALAILATGTPNQVIEAIEAEDERYLTKFPGVGKKTARQIILDLKGKFKAFEFPKTASSQVIPEPLGETTHKALQDAFQALKALGYSEREIDSIGPLLKDQTLSTEDYIKTALQLMLKK